MVIAPFGAAHGDGGKDGQTNGHDRHENRVRSRSWLLKSKQATPPHRIRAGNSTVAESFRRVRSAKRAFGPPVGSGARWSRVAEL